MSLLVSPCTQGPAIVGLTSHHIGHCRGCHTNYKASILVTSRKGTGTLGWVFIDFAASETVIFLTHFCQSLPSIYKWFVPYFADLIVWNWLVKMALDLIHQRFGFVEVNFALLSTGSRKLSIYFSVSSLALYAH